MPLPLLLQAISFAFICIHHILHPLQSITIFNAALSCLAVLFHQHLSRPATIYTTDTLHPALYRSRYPTTHRQTAKMFSKQVMISTALTMALNASSANVVSDQQTTITLFSGSPSATTWVHSVIPEPTSKVITAIAPTELNNDHAAAVLRADPCDTLLAVTCTATGPGQPCAGQTGQTTIMNIGPTAWVLRCHD
ncbi:hypothetical protein AC579_5590 [Pseudocercospora musae]|uniref:Uncharacterized protein n=1 Tax=Pseudocercospora musae TaxID=113226 RepID=A0A139IP82_9PEZI|nr:hypothetical protein AC579_5590 [Pseudocercospora musae]